jgi:GntR family transcriptional regulator/MocR family aminotransferase
MQTAPNTVFGHGDPAGSASLREALADYLGGYAAWRRLRTASWCARATRTRCADLICQVLRGRGASSIAFEDPAQPSYGALETLITALRERPVS